MTQQKSMPCFRPVIRVFVGPMFIDIKLERNALQGAVLRQMEQLCALHSYKLQPKKEHVNS